MLSLPAISRRLPTANLLPGLALCTVLALIAWPLGQAWPLLGAPVAGLLLGLLVGNVLPVSERCDPGMQFGTQQLLQWAIVGLGLQLSAQQLWSVGSQSLQVTLITLAVAFVSAWLLGRWLKLPGKMTLLIGAGTAICGGSAIAAIAPILRPNRQELTLALTTIFLFNLVAVFVFPALGHALNLSDAGFGIWAGTAINDTSSVVAAAYSYSHEAGDIATIVKLTRASLILPVCLLLALAVAWQQRAQRRRDADGTRAVRWPSHFPWFILGFVIAAVVHSLALLPASLEQSLVTFSHFLLVMALVAVGLSSRLKQLVHAGRRPVLLGLGVWVLVAGSSLGIQWLQGNW